MHIPVEKWNRWKSFPAVHRVIHRQILRKTGENHGYPRHPQPLRLFLRYYPIDDDEPGARRHPIRRLRIRMYIRCEQELLAAGLSVATRTLPARTTMPVLENIYIETATDHINIVCTDLQKGIQTQVEAEIEEEGIILMPGRIFYEMIRKLPKGEVEIRVEGGRADIRCGNSHTTLSCQDPGEYPSLPDVVSSLPIILRQEDLKEMIRQTAFAASLDESRPILTGVLLEISGSTLRTVALDGFRLAMRQLTLGDDYGGLSAVVPASALGEIGKILTGGDDKVYLTLTDTHLLADMGSTRFVTRLLEGEFIKYTQILPGEWQTRAKVDCAAFGSAIDRAATLAREGRNNLIRLSMNQSGMTLYADSDFGKVEEVIPAEMEGKDLEIAFNARYIGDVLKNMNDETAYLCFNTNVSPCVIRPAEGDAFLFLVLPVRIYA